MIAAILLLSSLVARAEMSTQSLVLGVNTCATHFESSLKSIGDDPEGKRADLITRHYCSCMMDATQTLGRGKKLTRADAKRCLAHSKKVVDGYLDGKKAEVERNLFDSKALPTSSVYTVFLVCMKNQGPETKDPARYCSCLTDALRKDPQMSVEAYVSGKAPIKPRWAHACGKP